MVNSLHGQGINRLAPSLERSTWQFAKILLTPIWTCGSTRSDVTEIECLVPDLTGVARGKILPRGKFTQERGMRIPEAVLGMTVTGNYPRRRRATTAPSPPPTAT
jgi:hypothetical protein